MQLQDILYSQGFGIRRVCYGLVQQGWVAVGEDATPCTDPTTDLEPEGLVFHVQGQRWQYHERAYLMLHKPIGHECSQKPSAWPSIYTLLPALVPLDRIGAQLMGAAVWLLGLSLVIGATDWAQRDLAAVAVPKLVAALITWLACLWTVVQRRRQRLPGAAFARASLLVAIPALVALYLSLPSSR
mgnify:CR=1 FL=1